MIGRSFWNVSSSHNSLLILPIAPLQTDDIPKSVVETGFEPQNAQGCFVPDKQPGGIQIPLDPISLQLEVMTIFCKQK